ncbi:MAG: PCYCGC motif-containing (lipo)protein [Candidatus Hodarchaeales archaeon]
MASRRQRRLKNKSVSKNKDKVEIIDKIDNLRMTNKKQVNNSTKNQNNINGFKISAISLFVVVVIILSAFVINNNSSPSTIQGVYDREIPDNMPNKYDSTLTTGEKLKTAYDYAETNGDLLEELICHCGCNNPMHSPYHRNNKECFWTSAGQYETHAENCSTCVYIALSAQKLFEAGWPAIEVRQFIDNQY